MFNSGGAHVVGKHVLHLDGCDRSILLRPNPEVTPYHIPGLAVKVFGSVEHQLDGLPGLPGQKHARTLIYANTCRVKHWRSGCRSTFVFPVSPRFL